jgi:HEAT repeats
MIQALLKQFQECDLTINEQVSDELVQLDSKAVVVGMRDLLRNPKQPPFVHKQAVKLLGRLQSDVVPVLREAVLGHPNESVRHIALDGLAQFDYKSAWNQDAIPPILLKVLQEPEMGLTAAAILGKFGSRLQTSDVFLVLDASDEIRNAFEDTYQRALANEGRSVVPYLLQAIKHANVNFRRFAAKALYFIGTEAEIPALLEALQDSDSSVCYYAEAALERIRDPQPVIKRWARNYFTDRFNFQQDEFGFVRHMRNHGFVNEPEEELLRAFQQTKMYLDTPCLNPDLASEAKSYLVRYGRSLQMCSEEKFFEVMREKGFVNEPEEELLKAYVQGVETVKETF